MVHTISLLARSLTLAAVLLTVAASPAHARGKGDASPNQIQSVRFDIHADIDRYNMFGVGARGELPVVPKGFIGDRFRDELALSFGVDFMFEPLDRSFYNGGGYAIPIVAAQWNFYFGPHWSVFPEAGLAVHMRFNGEGDEEHARFYPMVDLGLGLRYHFNEQIALLFKVGTPYGLQLGLVF